MAKTVSRKEFYGLLSILGLALTLILVAGAGLAKMGYKFATKQVHDQLVQEKITFPAAGSAALDPKEFPGLQRYGGQPVDNGPKAKAYADEFIWVHMMKASSGKTYAEVSAAVQAGDTKQAGLRDTLFRGDALRGVLLTAYAFSVFGMVAGYAAVVCVLGATVMAVLTLVAFARSRS